MRLFIPYWWSPRIYFIHMDEVAGGWRGLFLRIRITREPMWRHCFGFQIRVAMGIGAIERLRR